VAAGSTYIIMGAPTARRGLGRLAGAGRGAARAGAPRRRRSPRGGAQRLRLVQDPRIVLALLQINAHVAYVAVFALVAAESSGVPVPGETALIATGVLASDGQVHIEIVVALAALAAILGDNLGYVIGRTGGRRLLERPGMFEHHRHRILAEGQPFFDRHGAKAVFLGRWVAGLRIAAAWLAGINRMPWPRFVFWNGLGGIAWAVSVGLLAYYLGPPAEKIFQAIGIGGVALAAAVLLAVVLWRRMRREDRHDERA
jgi:membrane protein DedA with SNARE-associated domain